jgi:hypothetical protein
MYMHKWHPDWTQWCPTSTHTRKGRIESLDLPCSDVSPTPPLGGIRKSQVESQDFHHHVVVAWSSFPVVVISAL